MARDYTVKDVRAAAVLTASYVAGTVLEISEYNQLNLLVLFTKASSTSAQIKVEFSNDGTTYYQETFQSISSGTATETLGEHSIVSSAQSAATAGYTIQMSTKYRYVKVSAKVTGTVTATSLAIKAVLGDV